jgi:hypothetical protein
MRKKAKKPGQVERCHLRRVPGKLHHFTDAVTDYLPLGGVRRIRFNHF